MNKTEKKGTSIIAALVCLLFLYNINFVGLEQTQGKPVGPERMVEIKNMVRQGFNTAWKTFSSWAPFFQANHIVEAAPQEARTNDEQLMARAINGEARGEPYIGQVAVGAVIINRTKDPRFPKTIAGVIYQPGAFTAVSDGQINQPIDPKSQVLKAARDALNGWDPTDGCVYYFNPATATNKWIWSRQIVKKIGKHYFAK